MKNRYGDEYHWEALGGNQYKFVMTGDSMDYFSFGGLPGQKEFDADDLGFFDPAGGPFIGVGDLFMGRKINRIRSTKEGMIIEVE
jgi:hypothetical protein